MCIANVRKTIDFNPDLADEAGRGEGAACAYNRSICGVGIGVAPSDITDAGPLFISGECRAGLGIQRD